MGDIYVSVEEVSNPSSRLGGGVRRDAVQGTDGVELALSIGAADVANAVRVVGGASAGDGPQPVHIQAAGGIGGAVKLDGDNGRAARGVDGRLSGGRADEGEGGEDWGEDLHLGLCLG